MEFDSHIVVKEAFDSSHSHYFNLYIVRVKYSNTWLNYIDIASGIVTGTIIQH